MYYTNHKYHGYPQYIYYPYNNLDQLTTPILFHSQTPSDCDQNGQTLQSNFSRRTKSASINNKPECCLPTGCKQLHRDISITNEHDFLVLECSNKACVSNEISYLTKNLVHRACVQVLESQLVSILKNSSLTYGFSDKERRSSLWSGFDRWLEKFPNHVIPKKGSY